MFDIIISFLYIFITEGSVEMHLRCSEIYTITLLQIVQSVTVKRILKIGQ